MGHGAQCGGIGIVIKGRDSREPRQFDPEVMLKAETMRPTEQSVSDLGRRRRVNGWLLLFVVFAQVCDFPSLPPTFTTVSNIKGISATNTGDMIG